MVSYVREYTETPGSCHMVNELNSSGIGGKVFLKIRHAALEKAATAIKQERFALDKRLDKGQISKSEYQKDLMNLIVKGNKLRNERQEIEESMNGH